MGNINFLVNTKEMLTSAKLFNYAIAQININNLEWAKWVIETAKETNTPVILGVSQSAAQYMGGYKTVYAMVNAMVGELNASVPVALHLDHGDLGACKEALEAGFTSVMYDGSHLPFLENVANTYEVIKLCKKYDASLEVELGGIGNEENNEASNNFFADVEECKKMGMLNIDSLAINYGSYHGIYPKDWKGLNFDLLVQINANVKKPLVLHGGSGIPMDQIKKSISLGISKININTELQLLFAEKMREYFISGRDLDMNKKGYDPKRMYKYATPFIKRLVVEKFKLFGSFGVAKD